MPQKENPETTNVQVNDILKWMQDEAIHYGELGLSCNVSDINEASHQAFAESIEPGDEFYLQSYHLEQLEEERQILRGFAERRKLMETTLKPLVAQAVREVNCRLGHLGYPQRDLKGQSLRELVVHWTNLTKPQIKDHIEVYVNAGSTTGLKEMFQANLPLKASLADVEGLLEVAIKRALSNEGGRAEKGSFWKYQLITPDFKRAINKSSVHLKNDGDYHTLVDRVSGGAEAPLAILTQEKARSNFDNTISTCGSCPRTSISRTGGSKGKGTKLSIRPGKVDVSWDDTSMDEPLDTDGNPYFGPSDPDTMNRVLAKYAETHIGLMDE